MRTGLAGAEEVDEVIGRLIELAKELGILARSLSKEALDIEIRALVYQETVVPQTVLNKCRLATPDLGGTIASMRYLLENMEALKERIYG